MDKKNLAPASMEEIIAAFHQESGSIHKHLLTLYSIVIGLKTERALEIGAGFSTCTILSALKHTGGHLYSCNIPSETKQGNIMRDDLSFYCTHSDDFLANMKGPFEFALHDGAHGYKQLLKDLKAIRPLMRQYGIICVHDTQHSRPQWKEAQKALKDAFKKFPVSWVHLPYGYGLTIIRIEGEQPYEPLKGHWHKTNAPLGFTEPATVGVIH